MHTGGHVNVSESICPECFRIIPVIKEYNGDTVFLEKKCPDHGEFRVMIWDGKPGYKNWNKTRIPSKPSACATEVVKGCPFDCGLCEEHRQQTCCVLFELTERCNLKCPVCFASAGSRESVDPDLYEIEGWYRMLLESGGPYNIQLSGGEPTTRDDLPEIISMGIRTGFSFIQLNTNGIRIADEDDYASKLHDSGLSCVFLQFDGMNDKIQMHLRGSELMSKKLKAVKNCTKAGLGVVLVPTLIPGVNTGNIGEILKFAVDNIPHIRGVHFQPVSYFGRFPGIEKVRITIPEVIREIEIQSGGSMKAENFLPPGGENPYCSFHGNFIKMPDGKLKSWSIKEEQGCCRNTEPAADGSVKARQFVAKQWSAPSCCGTGNVSGALKKPDIVAHPGMNTDSLDIFLERVKTHSICISGMAFQDAWTLELDRLKDCLIHVVSRDRKLIPFCAYNLTSARGENLYRKNRLNE